MLGLASGRASAQ